MSWSPAKPHARIAGSRSGTDPSPVEVFAPAARTQGRFESILEALPDGVLMCGGDGTIRFANARMAALTGYTREELSAMSVDELVPERLRDGHAGRRSAYAGSPSSRGMGSGLEISCRCKDGSEVDVDISLSPMDTSWGPTVLAVVRDVTDRKRADASRRELDRRLAVVRDRERIASELAGEVVHALFAAGLQVQALHAHDGVPDPVRERLTSLVEDLDTAIRVLRERIFDLAPADGS